jgi:hypothetical protein
MIANKRSISARYACGYDSTAVAVHGYQWTSEDGYIAACVFLVESNPHRGGAYGSSSWFRQRQGTEPAQSFDTFTTTNNDTSLFIVILDSTSGIAASLTGDRSKSARNGVDIVSEPLFTTYSWSIDIWDIYSVATGRTITLGAVSLPSAIFYPLLLPRFLSPSLLEISTQRCTRSQNAPAIADVDAMICRHHRIRHLHGLLTHIWPCTGISPLVFLESQSLHATLYLLGSRVLDHAETF